MISKSKNSLAVIIPMYNEEIGAKRCVDAVVKVIKSLKTPTILIVINDGSTDSTGNILQKKKKQYGKFLVVVNYERNKGYGGAIQVGLKIAQENHVDWVLHMDSDLTNDPDQIKNFVKFEALPVDCVKASRYIKGGKVENVPLFRKIISYVGNSLASKLFNIGIKDCTNGFRMVRLSKLKNIHFKENNFSIILEELYYLKKRKAKFAEMPYVLTARADSASHFKYNLKIFYDYFKYASLSLFV